eukprot:m.55604 g.55604  ORF g.55604 m.55604 type:complete len:246 (+) comp15634_c1_seq1:137-874(+)
MQQQPPPPPSAPLTIFVDNRKLASCAVVVGSLRALRCRVQVYQLKACGFIVGSRAAVERLTQSEVATSLKNAKIMDRLKEMSQLFGRGYVIVETDREKVHRNGRTELSTEVSSRHSLCDGYRNAIAVFGKLKLNILYSQDQQETAQFLHDIAASEASKNHAIPPWPSEPLSADQELLVKFFMAMPYVNYVVALSWIHSKDFFSARDIIASSETDLVKKSVGLTPKRAQLLCAFFRYKFDGDLIGH